MSKKAEAEVLWVSNELHQISVHKARHLLMPQQNQRAILLLALKNRSIFTISKPNIENGIKDVVAL